MNDLIKQKGLQGKKGPIGFMDLLPDEEKFGYQIEQQKGGVAVCSPRKRSGTAETAGWAK